MIFTSYRPSFFLQDVIETNNEKILREGWGLAYRKPTLYREGSLYASEGSSTIYSIDPDTWTK